MIAAQPPPQPSISFVVPAYNEGEAPGDVVEEIRKAAEGLFEDFEIILVDDCSTDHTGQVMEKLAVQFPGIVRVVRNPRNLGLGGAYKAGVAAATKEYVMMVPGDNAHPAPDLVDILRVVGKAPIIVPYVVNPHVRQPHRVLLSRMFTGLANLLFGISVPYYNGLVVHRLDNLRSITIRTDSFAYQMEALARLIHRSMPFHAVGVRIAERKQGRTKAFRLKNIVQVVSIMVSLAWELRKSRGKSG